MKISDAEWDVMLVIWRAEPRTAAEVIEELAESHDWNHRTIRTLLTRLVEKGALTYSVDAAKYIYRSKVTQSECIRHRSDSFLTKVFGGDLRALVSHFVEDGQFSKSEIDELKQMLEAKGKSSKSRGKKS
ncbi:MAG: BlaI/MecI/CopY family transcriptional regulator [Planctomycetales bacterium]|nr:BlaI/MecI/CopY family transcriptional regulator [Planctomycetales bacterium]